MNRNRGLIISFFTLLLSVLVAVSCEDTTTEPVPTLPEITSVAPSSGVIAREVDIVISGNYLSGATLTSSDASVTISTVVATETQITATLTISGDASPGDVTLTVTTSEGSATVLFELKLPNVPSVSSMSPSSGEISDEVEVHISGDNFFGAIVTSSDTTILTVEISAITDTSIDATLSLNPLAFPISVDIIIATIGGSTSKSFSLEPAGLGGLVWSQGPDIATPRILLSAAAVGGKVYAMGGYDFTSASDVVEVFDPTSNTWTTESAMTTARYVAGAAAVNGKIYLAGGSDGVSYLSLFDVLDPTNHTWTNLQSMPTERSELGVGSAGSKLYAIGGRNSSGLLDINESYNAANNTWTTLASMPGIRSAIGAVSTPNRIYVIGGYDGTQYVSTLQYYNIDENNWTTAASMPTSRWLSTSTLFLGNILVVGGWVSGYESTPVIEALNPVTNTWSTPPPLPEGRDRAAIAVVGKKIYLVGGSKWTPSGAELQASTLIGELP